MQNSNSFDVAVVGAGVFGAWTAYQLCQSGAKVILIDGYGPANSRASSGGESRIIRMGYGPDEIYTKLAQRSFTLWDQFIRRVEPPLTNPSQSLFRQTGVLWVARAKDSYCSATLDTLTRLGVSTELLGPYELRRRYPQFDFKGIDWAILEPSSGALMARRAVQAVVAQAQADGIELQIATVIPPIKEGRIKSLTTTSGTEIVADKFIFACGPWLPKLFPQLLNQIIYITRQEVIFFGTPPGDDRFSPERMPIWVDFTDLVYAIPNLENRGFKIAIDDHGPEFDPDTGERVLTESGLLAARAYLERRIPALAGAPVTESRVCQYENTSNGDFLIDRHPHHENVWLVGGGSGHGFKHGPAVAEYVINLLNGNGTLEPRFALSSKGRVQQRQVY